MSVQHILCVNSPMFCLSGAFQFSDHIQHILWASILIPSQRHPQPDQCQFLDSYSGQHLPKYPLEESNKCSTMCISEIETGTNTPLFICKLFSFSMLQQLKVGLLIVEASWSQLDAPQPVGLLWSNDHPITETFS